MKKLAAFAFCAFAPLLMTLTASAQPVTLEVHFKLTDLDYEPLAGVPVRLVFVSDPNWQSAGAGQRATTDAKGEALITTTVTLEKVRKKIPTNVVGSLLSGPQPADHLIAGAELPSIGYRWLYVVDLYRFSGGDVLLDDTSIYSADAKGNFTMKARQDNGGWHIPDLQGLVLTSALYQPWNYQLTPPRDPKSKTWTLELAFKKSPDPVRR